MRPNKSGTCAALFLCVGVILPAATGQGVAPVGTGWEESCCQAIVVLAKDWSSSNGRMICLERGANGWMVHQSWTPVTLGRKGLGLGLGLHSDNLKGPLKEEGDKKAPAGIFRIEGGFGTVPLTLAAFPYVQTTVEDFWVDDPRSRFYNRWVRSDDATLRRDWRSAEVLRRSDGLYDYAIVIGHNREKFAIGRGSAIFMHAWSAPGVPTIGCTAMEKQEVLFLLKWLDLSKHPVLIQAPAELFPHLDISREIRVLLKSE